LLTQNGIYHKIWTSQVGEDVQVANTQSKPVKQDKLVLERINIKKANQHEKQEQKTELNNDEMTY
jgi:hypothetical protein